MKLAELLRKVMQPAKADRSSPAEIPRNKSQGTKKTTNLTERKRMKFENSRHKWEENGQSYGFLQRLDVLCVCAPMCCVLNAESPVQTGRPFVARHEGEVSDPQAQHYCITGSFVQAASQRRKFQRKRERERAGCKRLGQNDSEAALLESAGSSK